MILRLMMHRTSSLSSSRDDGAISRWCGEVWGNVGRVSEVWGGSGRCGEGRGGVGRVREVWGGVGRVSEAGAWGAVGFPLKAPIHPHLIVSHTHPPPCSVWDMASGKEKNKLEGHSGYVWSVAISPDGQTIVSGSYDKTIR